MVSHWNFRKISPAEMNSDPVQGEFFKNKSDIVDRLVRETLQNSLDARKGDDPVRVRFSIYLAGSGFSPEKQEFYFGGLLPHLREAGGDFEPSGQSLSYIVIEDFGTTGLTGDPEQTNDERGNDFYYFFRNVGRSGKGEDKGGSWGLGKWVLPDASKLNAFFALTCRNDENTLFMGQAVIKQHTIDGVKYDPYGFFSQKKDDDNGLQIPFNNKEDQKIIEDFRSDFNIQRNGESGLSIAIPFLSESDEEAQLFQAEDIVRSVIKYYFYPVVSNNLIIEISDFDKDEKWTLDTNSIKDVVSQIDWPKHRELNKEDLIQLIEMAMDRLTIEERKWLKLKCFPKEGEDMKNLIPYDKENLADRYNSGEILYFQIPVEVTESNGDKSVSCFTAIVQKDESVRQGQGKDYYVRGNLAIQDIDTVQKYPVRTFVHIEGDESLAHLLRDTEEPSHSDWKTRSTRAASNYKNVRKTVNFVKNAVGNILNLLSKDRNISVDKNAFIDVFYVPRQETSLKKNKQKRTSSTPDINPIGNPDLFEIARIKSGFTISASDSERLPKSIHIDLAYESKGNQLSKYRFLDFRLDEPPISIECQDCSYEGVENHLLMENMGKNFKVVVTGFDINRDLYIKAESVENGGNEDD